jgi:hypothetical protein
MASPRPRAADDEPKLRGFVTKWLKMVTHQAREANPKLDPKKRLGDSHDWMDS